MEQLKVKRKDGLVVNLILFLIMSFIFLYLQYAYRHHLAPFSMAYLLKSFELFWYAIVPLVACTILIWKHHRWSQGVFAFCIGLIGYKVIEGLFIEFNKVIVIALFFFIVISYFIYQLFANYRTLASLNANYAPTDLFDPLLQEISCNIKYQEKELAGYLTNWDEEGCFVRLRQTSAGLASNVKVEIQFKGRVFSQDGEVVAQSIDFMGVGIKFGNTPKELNVFNWMEFNELVHELGYKPERLR
jgi:hypothetical protein